jgi:NAD(P)-dependent dehydrogenase (short-subunit alcohol dehydrogenase family)
VGAMSTERGAVLITGASTGIGRATALHLDSLGFQVFAGVRKRGDAESLEEESSDRLEPVLIDVTDESMIEVTRARIEDVTGGRLAGLVNNAGVAIAGGTEFVPLDELRRQLEINVIGQVAVTQAFLPMIRAARGRVVLMSSIGGRSALPFLVPYGASKHALEALGDSLRGEMRAFGVEVSIIEPGSIATPIWAKGESQASEMRETMTPEQLEIYGDTLEKFAAVAQKTGAEGEPPIEVAKAIEHALTADKPKTRYLIGRRAKIQAALKKVLPDRVLDRLIAGQLGT